MKNENNIFFGYENDTEQFYKIYSYSSSIATS